METKFPVSVKGVIFHEDKVILLKNERDEWELPGGKLELDEKVEETLVREVQEELGIIVKVDKILDSWIFQELPEGAVVIITYGCFIVDFQELAISPEHKEVGMFSVFDLDKLKIPFGYKASIRAFWTCLAQLQRN